MEDQGDGSNVGPNDAPRIILGVDHTGDTEPLFLIFALQHPLRNLGMDIVAFFQRRVWDEMEEDRQHDSDDDVVAIDLSNLGINVNMADNNGDNDEDDRNNHGGIEGTTGAEVASEEHQQQAEEVEEVPRPGGSRTGRRSREETHEEEESYRSNKRYRWWDEFSASDSEERGGDEDDEDERSDFRY